MADVFISCEPSGHELAERLARALEREGFSVARNLPPEESEAELGACTAAVVIWTSDALASPAVLADADYARERGKLINARAADVDPDRVAGRFHSKHAIARADDAAIVAAVKELIGRGSQAMAARAARAAREPASLPPAAAGPGTGEAATASQQFLFVSHVAEDRKPAMAIVRKLEQRGVECWVAPRDVQAGRPYDDEIVDAIEASRAMLLIFSEKCNGNDYIRRELTLAGEAHKLIIPFRIEGVEPRGGLRARLVDLHRIDAFADEDAAVAEVVDALAELPSAAPRRAAFGHAQAQATAAAGAEKAPGRSEQQGKKRASLRLWVYGGVGAAGVIAAAVATLAWMGLFAKLLPPVPEWTFTGDTFVGKPIPFEWKTDHKALAAWKKRFGDAEILYELQSANDADFKSDARTENYAENERKDIWRSNASRFWRVSAVAVDGRSREPLPQSERAWSRVAQITQYDSAYQRILTTGQVLVYVSKSDNQDIFKWLDNKGGYKGFDISLAKAVVNELSARMRTSRALAMITRGVPWEDLLQAPGRGQADMIISSITKLARREPQYGILFSTPYFCTSYALIHRAGEPSRPIKEMVRDRVVGYQAKTTGEDVTTALRKDTPFNAREYESTELIVKAVVASEVDFGITDTPFAEAAEVQYRADGKELLAYRKFTAADLPPSIPPIQEYALAVPAGETELLNVVNDLMRRMQQQGKMTSLFQDAAAEYERDYGLKRGSRTDHRPRPWECAP
jgi:ABC-type amino acid transport substrate-binding protein